MRRWSRLAVLSLVVACAGVKADPQAAARTSTEPGPEPRIRVEAAFPLSPPRAIEFMGAGGEVRRRIEVVEESRTENGRVVTEFIRIAANERFAAVTHARVSEAELRTRLVDKRADVWSNRVTLYDARGEVLFENAGVEYVCGQVARSGDAVACLAAPPRYWEGPPDGSEVKPDHDTVFVLGRQGAVHHRFEEPRWSVNEENIRLSPNGRWLAYPLRLAGTREPHHVALHDLATDRTTEVPALGDERIGGFAAVSDDGDILDVKRGAAAAEVTWRTGVVELETVWRRPR